MEAIILAGGFGTRLSHIVKDVPKPMALVQNKPFLEYILNFLAKQSITQIILATGYKHSIIENYFKHSYKKIKISYSIEDSPLFTGGAIKKAISLCKNDNIFIINGDTFFDVNLRQMFDFHINNNADITIATKLMNNFDRYGSVSLNKNNNKINNFLEKKQTEKGLINGGIYIIKRDIFDLANVYNEKFSFEVDIMEKKVNDLNIYSFESQGFFIDIGIPEDYYKAQEISF